MDEQTSTQMTTGLSKSFRSGASKLENRICYGHNQGENGNLAVYNPEAKLVRWIFERYFAGDN